jgi:hypothetical protein
MTRIISRTIASS